MDFITPTLWMKKLRQRHEDLAEGCDLVVAEWDFDPGLSDSPCHFRSDLVQSLRKGGPQRRCDSSTLGGGRAGGVPYPPLTRGQATK